MTNLKFDDKGLIPVIAQDWLTNEVLMVAWANEESLRLYGYSCTCAASEEIFVIL